MRNSAYPIDLTIGFRAYTRDMSLEKLHIAHVYLHANFWVDIADAENATDEFRFFPGVPVQRSARAIPLFITGKTP